MKISAAKIQHFHELVHTNPAQALEELLTSELQFVGDPTFDTHYRGFLIDIGTSLGRADIVERGIHVAHGLLPRTEHAAKPKLLYDLANGYFTLHALARRQPDFRFDPDTTPLLNAKQYYREALADAATLPRVLRSTLRVNYSNCLSQLGRTVEAIDSYDQALVALPNHAMAQGNHAVELTHYVNIARDLSLLEDARDLLRAALVGQRLEETGLPEARLQFERTLGRVEARLAALGDRHTHKLDQSNLEHGTDQDQIPIESYREFCVEQHLFLNFALRNRPHAHPVKDTISLSITTAIDDDTTFYRLSRIINEMKERFATSRLLLYEACYPPVQTEPFDEMTYYIDNLDYAVYGVRAGKLKLAFEGAYNVLDKIAFFLNDYLAISMKEKDVSFTSIWHERNKKVLRPTLLDRKNWLLFGLYDVSRDLTTGESLNFFSTMRNYSTHRYLVPHVEAMSWREDADAKEYHIGYHELLKRTLELMQLVRSAIIYLIAFIDIEERRKHQHSKALSMPMFMPLAKPWSLGPQDTVL